MRPTDQAPSAAPPFRTVWSVIAQAAGWYIICGASTSTSDLFPMKGIGMLFGIAIMFGSFMLALSAAFRGEGHRAQAMFGISLLLPAAWIFWSVIPAQEPWGAPGGIHSFSVARDNSILIAGRAVARLHPDGTLDWEHPGSRSTSRIEALDDGLILIERNYQVEIVDSRGLQIGEPLASAYLTNCPVLFEIVLRPIKGLAMRCTEGIVILDDGTGHHSVIRTAAALAPIDPGANESGLAAHADGSFSLVSGNRLLRIGPDGKRRWQYQGNQEIYSASYAEDGSTYFQEGDELIRLDGRGERDRPFAPAEGLGGPVVMALPDRMVLASQYMGHLHTDFNILRLKPDGLPDRAFTPIKIETGVAKAARHRDGFLILIGDKLSRFDSGGRPDTTFSVPTLAAYRP